METTDRRGRRRSALREAIMAAARDIVREDGLAGLTMRRIGDAIDYSPASLYAHFPSREALLAALCHEGLHELRLALEAAVAGVADPRVRLDTLGAAYLRFALAHPETYRLIFMENPDLTKDVFESIDTEDAAQSLGLIVAAFAETGVTANAAEAARRADLFWMIVHGTASLRIACPDVLSTDDATMIADAIMLIAR